MRNVDSRIHSPRFDCRAFVFYSFSAVTFATQPPQSRLIEMSAGLSAFDHSGHVPNGEPTDTDFTVQGKAAEGVLMCACTISCGAALRAD
jgi:hypothetical protein